MVTVIPVEQPGTLGFAISGRLTRTDYEQVLLPPIRHAITEGRELRVLAVIDAFEGLEAGPLLDELRAAAKLGRGQRAAQPRFAVVSDVPWVRRGIALFGRLIPGEVRSFTQLQRPDAETWLATA